MSSTFYNIQYRLSTAKGPLTATFPIQHCKFLHFSLYAIPTAAKNITVFRETMIVAGATGCVICKLSVITVVNMFKCQLYRTERIASAVSTATS